MSFNIQDNDVIDIAKALAEVGTKVPQLRFEEVAPRSAGQYRAAIQGSLLDDINALKEEVQQAPGQLP